MLLGTAQVLQHQLLHGTGTLPELSPELAKEARNTVRDAGGDESTVEHQLAGADQYASAMAQVRSLSASTLADAGFTQPGGDVAFARFTEPPSGAVTALLRSLPFDVDLQWGAPMNEDQLSDITARIGKVVASTGVQALRAAPDSTSGEIIITAHFTDNGSDALARAAALVSADFPIASTPGVLLRNDPTLAFANEGGQQAGGYQMFDTQNTTGPCTAGFSVTHGSETGVVTARHCGNAMAVGSQSGTGIIQFVSEDGNSWEGGVVDLQWHRYINGWSGTAQFRSDKGSTSTVTSAANADINQPVCHFGYGTGYQRCSNVKARDVDMYFSDGVYYTGLTQTTTDVSVGGDSGGPWFTNGIARGIHKGSDSGSSYYVPQTQLAQAFSLGIVKG